MISERDIRQEWETPDDFFGVVNAEFRFQLDVAATRENRKCTGWIGRKENALSPKCPWIYPSERRVWLNPGFSGVGPWMKKAYEESQRYPDAVVVVMARISPSAKWWRNWAMKASEIRLLTGSVPKKSRVHFIPPPGVEASSNTQENCLIIFRPNPHNLPPRIWTWDWTKGLANNSNDL